MKYSIWPIYLSIKRDGSATEWGTKARKQLQLEALVADSLKFELRKNKRETHSLTDWYIGKI